MEYNNITNNSQGDNTMNKEPFDYDFFLQLIQELASYYLGTGFKIGCGIEVQREDAPLKNVIEYVKKHVKENETTIN
jgi:hypothetical protein